MYKQPEELSIIYEDDSNIFCDKGVSYVIPLYQRAFAWEDKEISQMVDDIYTSNEDNDYYLGSLIVSKKDNTYEVIDGQQRLTALFLLLNALDEEVNNSLTYSCRRKSDITLMSINNPKEIKDEDREDSLLNGKKIIDDIIDGHDDDYDDYKEKMLSQLKNVKIFRIELPPGTDLNRYFEIMNTRGEQLEQYDILKATLMGMLDEKRQKFFADVWDACSDMTGYVQMHFNSPEKRSELFWSGSQQLKNHSFFEKSLAWSKQFKENNKNLNIRRIIKAPPKAKTDGVNEKNENVRFDSIITFPFFLLHVLKVFVAEYEVTPLNLVPVLLDDKKLIDTFTDVITRGKIKGKKISADFEAFSVSFIECLLKCRYLFDKFIIKREYVNENTDGEWSLKELRTSDKKPYYAKTEFKQYHERGFTNTKNAQRNYTNLMLQSCLRVSYTAPKSMHWITTLLIWLNDDKNRKKLRDYEYEIENIAKSAVNNDYLKYLDDDPDDDDECDFLDGDDEDDSDEWDFDGEDDLDNDNDSSFLEDKQDIKVIEINHIVLNYLDYLLWKEDNVKKPKQKKYSDFIFEFRNSIEHWYPQNPTKKISFEKWSDEKGLHGLGNLCIIQRSLNSKFSNLSPEAKKSTYPDMISKGSIKLRIMSDLTGISPTGKNANSYWREHVSKEHEKNMIAILRHYCE